MAAILVEFDRRNTLTTEQWAKIEPIIARILKEYGPDIAAMFSYANSVPWYLQQHTMLMVFAGVPEKELKPHSECGTVGSMDQKRRVLRTAPATGRTSKPTTPNASREGQ